MADKVGIPREAPGPASKSSGEGSSHQFGLTAAMALIVGSIIGVGIFNLPTSLAAYGPITLVSMALTTVGALHNGCTAAARPNAVVSQKNGVCCGPEKIGPVMGWLSTLRSLR